MCNQDDLFRREPFMNGAAIATLHFRHELASRHKRFCRYLDALTPHGASRFTSYPNQAALSPARRMSYVRKNTNQTTARIRIASPVDADNNASTEGPGSACRASVGVSTIRPCSIVAMVTSFAGCHCRKPRALAAS